MKRGWKQATAELVLEHNQNGLSCILDPDSMGGENCGVRALEEVPVLEIGERMLGTQVVRQWLWEQRKQTEKAEVLYSWYDEEGKKSVVGLGVLVQGA